jgi:predicted transcriptional regulator
MNANYLVVDPEKDFAIIKGLASETRVSILRLLIDDGPTNVNLIAEKLDLPQSSVSTNVRLLEDAGLVVGETQNARKGTQKICRAVYDELIVRFESGKAKVDNDAIEVSMPLGLYSHCEITSPCGICSSDGIIGLLDVPASFLEPDRMKTALLWFTSGYVEYQFPNNAHISKRDFNALDIVMEVSSEVPGTNPNWPSDITLSINDIELGVWTSPGDFGDQRGLHTPRWWKLKGSQYGMLKSWSVTSGGTFVDGIRISNVTFADLGLSSHRSIRVRIGVDPKARHPGGLNIFGRGFGNYDQDIIMRLHRSS